MIRAAEADRPLPRGDGSAAVLLFDGTCGFCTAATEWLARRFCEEVRLLPWQNADLPRLGLSEEEARRSVWWIEPGGERVHSERAVARALIACGGAHRRLGLWLLAPGVHAVAALGYRITSRVRHHLPGTRPALDRPAAPDVDPLVRRSDPAGVTDPPQSEARGSP